ncbi:cupin domain-containing protein [Crocosphaera sp. XPORK-15E]|uniref:cupin domain-containing protein n=1 Tax=Crocosphaera sp. XPORK-15E TaxID=3110247 RepID=UPI002B1EDF09|nr:cupin domain-containing protein [Crocosphaera sp. XPORK-15E]MEA5535071.1 cupin domain-containing protein [Crocosphaera sp. XPORK-15E]
MKLTVFSQLPIEFSNHNHYIQKKVMLKPGDIPNLTNFSQATFTPGQKTIPHLHETMYEVFFVESGEGIIRINEVDYPLLKGNCITVEPGEVHELMNRGSTDLILTYFGIVSE